MLTSYQFFPNQTFLLMRLQGEFSIEAYKKTSQVLQKNKNWRHLKYFLLDLREVKSGKEDLFLKELVKVRKISEFSGYKMAYVVEDAKILANLHLYRDYVKSSDYEYFSTLKSAINHLGIVLPLFEMEKRIQQLENTIK